MLGKRTCDQIIQLLSVGHGQPALRAIVSGPLDADKQDYLLRDSYFCGVPYGVFDLHQLHRSFTLIGVQDEKDIAIEPDGVSEPENDELRGKIEASVAELLRNELKVDVDKRIVILHGFNIQSVRASSRNDEASIMIACAPRPKPFEGYSPLFQSIKEGYADGEVAVYAPVNWETRADRNKIRQKLREPIHQLIENLTIEALKKEQPPN